MILVIGATGTVGSEVVRQLLARGVRPRVIERNPRPACPRAAHAADRVIGDLDRPECLPRALAGIDRVFLLTRQTSRQLDQELAVVEAAAAAGIEQVVKLSVFCADEESPLQIARQHRTAERALERSGVGYTVLRPPFFMQNLLRMVRGGVLHSAARDGRVAMIDARDIAGAAVTALTRPGHTGRTYTLTGPEALTFDDVATVLTTQIGRPVRHVRVPPDGLRAGLLAAGTEAWFATDMVLLHEMLADGYEDLITRDLGALLDVPPRPLLRFAHEHRALLGADEAAVV
jgi:uncharacterized protein YbjT (DUF2867 family)